MLKANTIRAEAQLETQLSKTLDSATFNLRLCRATLFPCDTFFL